MDRISELPDDAIDNILERLCLRDAVRTSILSRKWRYKWTTLSTLSLSSAMIRCQKGDETFPGLVQSILLQHNGVLHKFEINLMDKGPPQATAKITLAIRVALLKGVQELTVGARTGTRSTLHILPSFLFSCGEQLTKLKLTNCVFNPPFGFRGFSNLKNFSLSLGLRSSDFDSERLSSFVSSCPKLQKITLFGWPSTNHLNFCTPSLEHCCVDGCFTSILFQEAPNLVSLRITMYPLLIEETIPSNDYMLQLFSNIAKIKYLSLGGYICHLLGTDCAPRKLPTILHDLKTIEVGSVNLGRVRHFHCILRLIMSSPNLQNLHITVPMHTIYNVDPCIESADYKDCYFQHLEKVSMSEFTGSKAEWKLIEILLAKSPVLQELFITIEPYPKTTSVLKKLKGFLRASPTAQFRCVRYSESKSMWMPVTR